MPVPLRMGTGGRRSADAAAAAADLHTRMPVLLREEEWPVWIDGSPADARALCEPWLGDLVIERTDQSWAGEPAAMQRLL